MIFKPSSPAAYRLLMEGSAAFADIEEAGIRVDMRHVDRTMRGAGEKIKQIEASLRRDEVYKIWRRVYGEKASLGSGEQLARVIFGNLGVECKERTATGKPKTDAEALEGIDLPFVRKWSMLEKLKKVRNTFLRGTQRLAVRRGDDWFIHPSFNLHLVWTYRSCVAKGTLVEVVRDVREFPKGIPIEDVKAGDLAYCYDDNLNLTVKRVKWAGKTGHRHVVRLHWSARGKHGHLDVTPEHLIRLSSGEYVEARHLSGDFRAEGDSKHAPKVRTLAMGRVGSRIFQTGVAKDLLDHQLVYRSVVGDIPVGAVIHHRDGNHLNNVPENLELMGRADHSRLHVQQGDCLTAEDIKRGLAASTAKRLICGHWSLFGPENPKWIHFSKFGLLRMLSKAGGKVTRICHDFKCIRDKAKRLGIDLKVVRDRYDKNGVYISRGRLLSVFDGSIYSVSSGLRIGRDKADRLLLDRGFVGNLKRPARHHYGRAGKPHNHRITKIEYLENAVDVYDIEVEDHHNFIANEICVHNSSSEPNFQNQPVRDKRQAKLIRRAYIPRDGHVLVETDYAALEFRGAANFWKDPAMVTYASDPKLDIHRDMAGECFLLPVDNVSKDCRAFAKNQFVFPELYGSYYVSMAAGLWTSISRAGLKTKDGVGIYEHLRTKGIRTAKEFEGHIKRVEQKFNERFAHWSRAKDRWWQKYLERGWFPLATGFVCPGIFSYNNLMNTPIQGPSFHCLLWSVIQVNAWLKKNKMRSKIVGQIHDSILADVYEPELQDYLNYVREVMTVKVREHWDWIITPLDVEVDVSDRSWFDKSPWKEENGLWVSA
jgi:hypothetical protein